jgi:hypothetical protein
MFKAFTILALGAVASAQFLSRDLQTTLQQTQTSAPVNNVTVATSFSTACTVTATSDSCPGLYCCAGLKRAGAAVSTAAAVCAPIDFNGTTFNVGSPAVANVWTCLNSVNANALRNLTSSRVACTSDDNCTAGSCCATFTDSFGPTATPAVLSTRRFCLDGSANGTQVWGSYVAGNVGAGIEAKIVQGSCTNVVAAFGAYIKASAMMLVALISVALF